MRLAFFAMGLATILATAPGCAANSADDADVTTADLTALPACAPLNDACAAPAWSYEPRAWKHGVASRVVTHLGDARHRGRDMFVNPGEKQTVHAKFAYGLADKDLHGEEIDVFVQRDCASGWTKLGTAITTEDGEHETVDGVEDNGGRIYFDIPAGQELALGRHRIRTVVAGDGTFADSFIDVVAPGTPIFVSDVDGTLTSSESIEWVDMLIGKTPQTHDGAPEAFQALASKGYRMIYLTARPEWLTQRTRDFLAERGFPQGLVHTSTSTTGAGVGAGAANFKTAELALLKAKGLIPTYGFGNKPSDSDAYATIVPDPQHRIFYQIKGEFTGRAIQSYESLIPEFQQSAAICR